MVERGSGVAVWRQIGEQLADDIRKKVYPPGDRLPTEPELAEQFMVNRHTIRRAMSELEKAGLIRIEQGRGTFVQEHAIDYAIGKRTRFSENLFNQGLAAHIEVVGSQRARAADIAQHLGLARTASLLKIQSLGKTQSRCIDVSDHYLDAKRFPDFSEQVRTLQSISRAYLHYGIADYFRKWTRITAVMPTPDIARYLGQPKTRPILQVESLNVDTNGVPLHYSVTRFGGDLVQLVIDNDTP
jgi:GntR family phosphonate transport system transcriptional regulator